MSGDSSITRQRLKHIAWFLDSSIRLPGGFRIGAESVVGLIPGVGDTIGAIVSSYIVYQAAKLGVSMSVLLKMIANVLLEAVIGIMPIVGDIFDMAYKANMRNVQLLETYQNSTKLRPRTNKKIISLLLALFFILIVLIMCFAIYVFSYFVQQLNQI